ncbi:hypothetical protein GCM10023196_090140 [Actinoallomurus vinaceus]|uniref:Uncharacterized protein n=1 Tax=Actinoallomurus vinaceus TaxID=1080074 RepID=A0ABP8UQZ9_9ACTN
MAQMICPPILAKWSIRATRRRQEVKDKAASGERRLGLTDALAVADTDDPHSQRDRAAHGLGDVRAGARVAGPPGDYSVLPRIVGIPGGGQPQAGSSEGLPHLRADVDQVGEHLDLQATHQTMIDQFR